MTLSFLRLPPSPDLADAVENFWFMDGPGVSAMPEGHRILPDGSMEFVFQLGRPFREKRTDGRFHLQGRWLFVGQMDHRVDVRPTGVIRTVGVHFRPAGAAAFVDGDLGRFMNRIVSLERALGARVGGLARKLGALRKPEDQALALETFLRARRHSGDTLVAEAARRLSAPEAVDLENLARDLGLSDRQFRRRFEAVVGIGPKKFNRLVRFQRVFEREQETDARAWSDVALDCGYYDQAHFNRDFRAFSGMRPRDVVKDPDPLTTFFLSVSSKTGVSRRG